MITPETRYETHDQEFLAIVEAFKTWRHYVEGCKYEVLVLIDHTNLRQFMDTNSLSSRQVRWVKELFRYHFRIDYRQKKANGAADALSRFPQRSTDEETTLRAENTQILHCLQSSLTKAGLEGLSLTGLEARPANNLFPLHQVFICGTHVLPWLCQFWNELCGDLATKGPYQQTSIGAIRWRLLELQEKDQVAKEVREQGLKDSCEDIDGLLHHQGLSYVFKIIRIELISRHHNNPLVGHFGVEKTGELVVRKYYWLTLQHDVEVYVKGCDICLASKAVRHKSCGDLQLLLVPTYCWKDLSMEFMTGLPILTNWKSESNDLIFVIVDRLTIMVHYKPVKVTIDAPDLAEIIINVVVRHHGLPNSIVSDRGSVFTSKFWSSLCYFLGIKQKLSTAFHLQTDGQTKRQNSAIEAYF